MDIGAREVGMLAVAALATRGVLAFKDDIFEKLFYKAGIMKLTLLSRQGRPDAHGIPVEVKTHVVGAKSPMLIQGNIEAMQSLIKALEQELKNELGPNYRVSKSK